MKSRKSRAIVLAILAASLISAVAVSCRSRAKELGINIKLETRKLSNGLTVILVEDHTVPIVSYQTFFRVGSVDEKPGITGISHLFEHLMFKGTPRYGAKDFFNNLEAKGAEVNAFTGRDHTVYYENFVPSLLEKVIDMESDRMTHLTLNETVLSSERAVVFEERRLRTDNSPEGKIQEALWQLAFHRHPYQWPVVGYPQDLLTITLPQIMAYYRTHYQPANATVVIVGDIQPEATFRLIKKYYGIIPERPVPQRRVPEEPEQAEERRLVLRDAVSSERLAQAYHISSAANEDSYSIDVLSNILFEGTSSRAYRCLVEDRNIATSVAGTSYTPTYPGLFIIAATLKNGLKAELAEEELARLIADVQDNGVTDDEIQIAVRQLTVQLVDSVRNPYGLGELIGLVQLIFDDPYRFTDDLSKYLKVTGASIRKVAQKYLIPNNRSVVTMIPAGKKEASKDL